MLSLHLFRLVLLLLLVGVWPTPMRACSQVPGLTPHSQKDEVSTLIDKLQDIAKGDVGYMTTMSGSAFLPLGKSEFGAGLLGQRPPASSNTMRELVKHGASAVPQLVAHLDDKRQTKISVKQESVFGGIFFDDEYDYNHRIVKTPIVGVNRSMMDRKEHPNHHTVTVGDLCFVALGQIVNRHFNAVRYQPTACIMINSPTHSEALRKVIIHEWGNLKVEQHKQSLIRDFENPDYEDRRNGACLRLGFYYPDALEALVLKQLAMARYNVFSIESLLRSKLYPAKAPKERQSLLETFLANEGDAARDGIVLYLFEDLSLQEADEEGRLSPPLKGKYAARACLIELFGYPKDVKSSSRPYVNTIENCALARFIDTLIYFPTPKIDQAVRRIMHSTEEEYLVRACARYLTGRGVDADIKQYIEKRLKSATASESRELDRLSEQLGWTPLHAAVAEGEPERIVELILKGSDVNAVATNGRTPLHIAADHGKFGAIPVLLKNKANPNIKDVQGLTPIQLALNHSFDSAVTTLLQHGAEVPDIIVASFAGRTDLVKAFLQKDKALVNAKTAQGDTPLLFAARLGHLKVAELLIANGADVNASDKSQITPLHWAASYDKREIVLLLLANKADRNAKSWDKRTPLQFARESHHDDIVRLLEESR